MQVNPLVLWTISPTLVLVHFLGARRFIEKVDGTKLD
jgi:hypothetical protein